MLYILKIQKTYGTFWKEPFQNQPKSVRLQATYGNLHYLRKWFRQCNLSNLSSLNITPHTIAYLLILYLQSKYPKIANLIHILYIVCRALGCFKGGSCERFAIDDIQTSTTRRTGFNWCEAVGYSTCEDVHPLLREKTRKASINSRKSENYALKVRSLKSSQSLLKCPRSLRLFLPSTQKR